MPGFADTVEATKDGLIFCVIPDDVLPVKLGLSVYTDVIVWPPTESEDVVNVAWPAPSRAPVPIVLAPSLKATVPVGIPAPGDTTVTVAVNVTGRPNVYWLAEDDSDVVVEAWLTVCVNEPVLEVKLLSPEYSAVMLWLPTESEEVANVV